MASVEELSGQITAAQETLRSAGIESVRTHLEQAYQHLASVGSDKLSGAMQDINGALGGLLAVERSVTFANRDLSFYLASIGLQSSMEAPMPAQKVEAAAGTHPAVTALHDLFDSIMRVTSSGHPPENRIVNEIKFQATQQAAGIRAALRDPDQAGTVLQSLRKFLPSTDPYRTPGSDSLIAFVGGQLLANGNDTPLLHLAQQGEQPDLAAQATDMLVGVYATLPNNQPAATTFIAGQYRAIVTRYVQAPSNQKDFYTNMGAATATTARLLAETTPEEMSHLKHTIDTMQASTGSEAGNRIKSIYEGALARLATDKLLQRNLLAKAGVDPVKALTSWRNGFKNYTKTPEGQLATATRGSYMYNCVKTMIELEAERPGACKELARSLGVMNYARYTPSILRDAHEALIGEPPEAYLLFVSAESDHNGAFVGRQALKNLVRDMRSHNPTYKVIPIELTSTRAIWPIRRRLIRKGWRQADHLILNAHGSPTAATLGEDNITSKASSSNTSNWHMLGATLRMAVKKDGTVSLCSCSTGKGPGSLAQYAATIGGRRVMAPREDVALKEIAVAIDPHTGKPVPQPVFVHEQETSETVEFLPQ